MWDTEALEIIHHYFHASFCKPHHVSNKALFNFDFIISTAHLEVYYTIIITYCYINALILHACVLTCSTYNMHQFQWHAMTITPNTVHL